MTRTFIATDAIRVNDTTQDVVGLDPYFIAVEKGETGITCEENGVVLWAAGLCAVRDGMYEAFLLVSKKGREKYRLSWHRFLKKSLKGALLRTSRSIYAHFPIEQRDFCVSFAKRLNFSEEEEVVYKNKKYRRLKLCHPQPSQ